MPQSGKHCAPRAVRPFSRPLSRPLSQALRRASGWTLALLFAALTLLPCALAGTPAAGAAKAPAKPVKAVQTAAPSAAQSAEGPAEAPVRRFQTLLARKKATLEALHKLETELEQARNAKPDGPSGAKAAYFLARVQEEIALKSGLKADWSKSAESFGVYLGRFPKHQLAPEALLKRGQIRLQHLADPEGAASDFQTLLRAHPRSPRAAQAKPLARQAAKAALSAPAALAKPAPAARKPEPEPREPEALAPRAHGEPALLMEIRHKGGAESGRVVLELDEPVRYKYQLLENAGGKGRHRLYVDLQHTRLGRAVQADQHPASGLVKSIRAAHKDADTTRVVLECADIKDYKVQALDAPFRLVVDVYATQAAKAQAEDSPPAEAPKPSLGFTAPTGSRKRLAADLVEQLGLSVRTIMIDAGHGGKDPGAQALGLTEKDVNLRMALILGKALKERGFTILYTRTTDVFLALEERTAQANAKKADLFISVHCNAHSDPAMSGLETYSLNLARTPDAVRVAARENAVSDRNISDLQMILTDLMLTSKIKESLDLARGVHQNGLAGLRRKWTVKDHGNREAPFYVLMGAKMPSVLLEIGYLTNKTEASRLATDAYLKILAKGVADGVVAYKLQIERHAGKNGKNGKK